MVTRRTNTGLLKKVKKGDTLTADVYIKFPRKKLSLFRTKKKIYLNSNRKATVVSDGMPLIKKGNKWIYFVK